MQTNQFGNQTATAMKGDIVSALSLSDDKARRLVSVQDFSNSGPLAFIETEYLDQRLVDKMNGLGWSLMQAHTKTSTKLITAVFNLKKETSA